MLWRPDLSILSLRTKAASVKIYWPSLQTTCATWPSWSTWSTSPCDPALTWASFPAQICEFLLKMCLISNPHNSALHPICIISTPVARLVPQLQPLFSTPSSQMALNTLKRPKTGRRNCTVLC